MKIPYVIGLVVTSVLITVAIEETLLGKEMAAQQEILKTETGKFLNEEQMAAFQEDQNQVKEMQLMGLKMAEKMMPGKQPASP